MVEKNKLVNYNPIIAVIFIIIIFYIGLAAMFPSILFNIGYFVKNENKAILEVINKIDIEYRNMLDFKGNPLINKGAFINLNGLMARVMGQRYMNDRVKLDNGHLTYLLPQQDVTRAVIQLTKLYNAQKENRKHFLFVLVPYQVPKYENIFPVGYEDYGNQNADNLIHILNEHAIPVLDLRDEMIKDGINNTDAFFKTDHHWTPETGFWAHTKIINYFIQAGIIDDIEPKYTDINEYNVETLKNWFLGSNGKRTGSYYAGVDDFSIITPKFKTDISLEIPLYNIFKSGSFADVIFHDLNKIYEKNYFTENPYGNYGYGDNTGKIYINKQAPIDLKILSIRDSFACVTTTFLPIVIKKCYELDFRQNNNTGGFEDKNSFKNFYLELNPDIILVLINPSNISSANTTYDFFNDLKE